MVVYDLKNNLKASCEARHSKYKSWLKHKVAVFFAALFLIPVLLTATATGAVASEWVVKRVSGIVYFVAPGVEAFRVKRGMAFEEGYTMGTRAGGRALIARGEETISVGPNTTFAMSKYLSNNSKTTLLQRKGTVTVDVAKRSRPHFFVETPFLAAVVKGTRFDVTVDNTRARVSVDRGVVGVEDFSSGDRADLTAGQNASSANGNNGGLSVGGRTKPEVRKGPKRNPKVAALGRPEPVDIQSERPQKSKGLFGGLFGSNSNGNSNGNGNGNSNGNGNGNSNGNGNGNSNGNGNGNSNGNGNGNSNGNGNGNSNGNGNGNSNGNSGK
ncbi:FecR family protein [Roseibium sp.]|uniref:FecR family protein n=1 Tax=Roseibium sp. TaxID=1936156 RepID=UPI003B505618